MVQHMCVSDSGGSGGDTMLPCLQQARFFYNNFLSILAEIIRGRIPP